MFAYTPLTNEQIEQNRKTVEPGDVYFEVISATEKTSKENKIPMIELQLKLTDKHGTSGVIRDYLLATPSCAWKLKSFCESINEENLYSSGNLSAESVRFKHGNVKIKKVFDNGFYRLKVVNYLKHRKEPDPINEDDLDIPF